jgi:hypothetical protein
VNDLDPIRALLEDRDALVRDAEVPRSGLVWWRLQLRLRNEQAAAARRAIVAAHVAIVGLAVAIGLLFLGARSVDLLHQLVALASAMPLALLVAMLTAWVALAPVAAWLALKRE